MMQNKFKLISVALAFGLLLGGCGEKYQCDTQEYAEQALNILLFDDAKGSEDKEVSLKSLGYEIGKDITLVSKDKENKASVCRVKVSNGVVDKALSTFKLKEWEKTLSKEEQEVVTLGVLSGGEDGALAALIGLEILKNSNISRESEDKGDILALGSIAAALQVFGMNYKVYMKKDKEGKENVFIESKISTTKP